MLELRGIDYSYPESGRQVLHSLDLRLHPGELSVLMGANGSGKSTLARLISGLISPDKGEIRLNGKLHNPESFPENNFVGLVRQDPKDQLVAGEVDDEVAFGPENLALPRDEIARRVKNSLSAVGLRGFERRETGSLSAGQQQRLAIAGILAMQPNLVIFDESSSMLDPAARRDFYRLCRSLADSGIGVLSISHFPEEALAADRLLVIDRGSISADGKPRDIFLEHPRLKKPFVMQVTEALADLGINLEIPPVRPEELAQLIAAAAGQP